LVFYDDFQQGNRIPIGQGDATHLRSGGGEVTGCCNAASLRFRLLLIVFMGSVQN
jgi:hypothetical protein